MSQYALKIYTGILYYADCCLPDSLFPAPTLILLSQPLGLGPVIKSSLNLLRLKLSPTWALVGVEVNKHVFILVLVVCEIFSFLGPGFSKLLKYWSVLLLRLASWLCPFETLCCGWFSKLRLASLTFCSHTSLFSQILDLQFSTLFGLIDDEFEVSGLVSVLLFSLLPSAGFTRGLKNLEIILSELPAFNTFCFLPRPCFGACRCLSCLKLFFVQFSSARLRLSNSSSIWCNSSCSWSVLAALTY